MGRQLRQDDPPLISALVCTCGRGGLVVDTVLSILANTHPNFELVVVDQSKDNETLEALKPFGTDPRLRYLKIATIGKGNALNAGLRETKGSVIAITDDDCTVPPNWLEKFASIFATHPKVAVAFCGVEAGATRARSRGRHCGAAQYGRRNRTLRSHARPRIQISIL